MSIDSIILLFSAFVGALIVIGFPVAVTLALMSSHELKKATRLERITALRVSFLAGSTLLALYTYYFVTPSGVATLIDATTLWIFCGIGVAMFFGLTPLGRKAVRN